MAPGGALILGKYVTRWLRRTRAGLAGVAFTLPDDAGDGLVIPLVRLGSARPLAAEAQSISGTVCTAKTAPSGNAGPVHIAARPLSPGGPSLLTARFNSGP
jgi:hypothetical protein